MTFFGIFDAFAKTITIKPTFREQVRQNLDPAPGNFHKQMVLESLHYTSKLSTKPWPLTIPQPQFNPIGTDAFNVIRDFIPSLPPQRDEMLFTCHELPIDAYARKHVIKAWSRGSKEGLAGIHLSKFPGEQVVRPTKETYRKLTKEARFEEKSNDAAISLKEITILPSTLSALLEIDLCFQRTDGDWHHCVNAAKHTLPIIQAAFASNPLSLTISSFTIGYQIYNQDYQAVVTTALLTAAFTTGAFIGLPAAILTGGLLIWSGYEAISLAINTYKVHTMKSALPRLDAESICTIADKESFDSAQYIPYLQSQDQNLLMKIASRPVGTSCKTHIWKLAIERAVHESSSDHAINVLKEHRAELIIEQNFDWVLHLADEEFCYNNGYDIFAMQLIAFVKESLSSGHLTQLLNKVVSATIKSARMPGIGQSLLKQYKSSIVTEDNMLWVANIIERDYDSTHGYEEHMRKIFGREYGPTYDAEGPLRSIVNCLKVDYGSIYRHKPLANLLVAFTKELLPAERSSQVFKGIILKKLSSRDSRQVQHATELLRLCKIELITEQNVDWILKTAQTNFHSASLEAGQEFTLSVLTLAKDLLIAERFIPTTLELVKSIIKTTLASQNHSLEQAAQALLTNYKDILVAEQNVDWIIDIARINLQESSSVGSMKFALYLISLAKHIIPTKHEVELLSASVKAVKIVITKLLSSSDLSLANEARALLDQYETKLVNSENFPWILRAIKIPATKIHYQGCKEFADHLIDLVENSALSTKEKAQIVKIGISAKLSSGDFSRKNEAKALLDKYKTELITTENLPWALHAIKIEATKSMYNAFAAHLIGLVENSALPIKEKAQLLISASLSSGREGKAKALLDQYKTELMTTENLSWILHAIKIDQNAIDNTFKTFTNHLIDLVENSALSTKEKTQIVKIGINAKLSLGREDEAKALLDAYQKDLMTTENLSWILDTLNTKAANIMHCPYGESWTQHCKKFADHLIALVENSDLPEKEKMKAYINADLLSGNLAQENRAKDLLDQHQTDLMTSKNSPWILDTLNTQSAQINCQGCKEFADHLRDLAQYKLATKESVELLINAKLSSEDLYEKAEAKTLLDQHKTELVTPENFLWIFNTIKTQAVNQDFANHLIKLAQEQLTSKCEEIIFDTVDPFHPNAENCQQLIELVGDTSH